MFVQHMDMLNKYTSGLERNAQFFFCCYSGSVFLSFVLF